MRRFKNILLFTGTEDNGTAIHRGIELAKENNAQLTFMDVIKPVPAALGILTLKPDGFKSPVEMTDQVNVKNVRKMPQTLG